MTSNSKMNGKHLIFRPYVIKDGKMILPTKGKCLAFWVDD